MGIGIYFQLPSWIGIISIGYLLSAANSISNIVPASFLQSTHPHHALIYCRNKSFAFQWSPLLPALLFLFTSVIYIETPELIYRGVAYAVCGIAISQALVAFYFTREIHLIDDNFSLKIFRTGVLKRFILISIISLAATALFFYTILLALNDDKSIARLNPFRMFGESIPVHVEWVFILRVFALATALYLESLPNLWRRKNLFTKSDHALVYLCCLAWSMAVATVTLFVFIATSLSDPNILYPVQNFLLTHLMLLGLVALCGLYFVVKGKNRTIKDLRQPTWNCKKNILIGFFLFFTATFTGSLFYTESSFYSVLAAVIFFAVVAQVIASRKKLEDLIQERTNDLNQEKSKVDSLLLNILPAYVIEDLKNRGESQPRQFENVAVLFTDFVGFTKISASLEPKALIAELNEMFTAFDEIVNHDGSERIKTIGDAYMAVSGLTESKQEPAHNMVECAKKILAYIQMRNQKQPIQWEIRIGIAVGRGMGGVVGKTKYLFDLFGDTINIASRMESNSAAMRINVSQDVYLRLKDQYEFIEREPIEVKGKGSMKMYFLKT